MADPRALRVHPPAPGLADAGGRANPRVLGPARASTVVRDSACARGQGKCFDFVNVQVLGMRVDERPDHSDLVADAEPRRKGWKNLHDVEVKVRSQKEMNLAQRTLGIVLPPDVEKCASHSNASVDERAILSRLAGEADMPQGGRGVERVPHWRGDALEGTAG